MQLTEQERAALVDELTAAMGAGDSLQTEAQRVVYTSCATACLPIIERLLAAADAPGLDELLDGVHPTARIISTGLIGEGEWLAAISCATVPWTGIGPTRYEAIKAAVVSRHAALKAQENDDE